MNLNEFIEKFCKNCEKNCDKGIIEKENFIRCIDRGIYIDKKDTKNKNNQ